jgi:hypothetical protein
MHHSQRSKKRDVAQDRYSITSRKSITSEEVFAAMMDTMLSIAQFSS